MDKARKTKIKTTKVERTNQQEQVERTIQQDEAVTAIEYGKFQEAYTFFNAELFGGRLPNFLITMPRKANSAGYFHADRFSSRMEQSTVSELALNPDAFTGRTDEQILSTLGHEMAHGWQYAYGKPSKRGYHNKEWAAKMKSIGLQPSSTGMVDGKETGYSVSHYIIPGGAFARAYAKLQATGFKLNWESTVRSNNTKPSDSKTKFTCSTCGQNVWGKPDSQVRCGICPGMPIMHPAGNGLDGTNQLEPEFNPLAAG